MSRAITATIDLAALRRNFERIRASAPDSRVLAVVKADAYGHGLERVACALPDADGFGVAAISEAERLRASGLRQPIVLMTGFDEPGDLAQLRRLQVTTVIHHEAQLAMLEACRESGPAIPAWLKLDTGMHRLGFPPAQARAAFARLRALDMVADEIVLMTHFASSEEFGGSQTRAQIEAFDDLAHELVGPRSAANSAAIIGWPQSHRQWVRAGGALYGLSVAEGKSGSDFGFAPVMTLSTRLIAINRIARGERVGYSGSWECPEDMDVGVAAVGYGDGYPRTVPAGTPVLVNGARVPVIGRVSMDLMTLDLRGQSEAQVGDPVLLWGPGLPVEEIAAAAGTISYDLTCAITRRVPFLEA